jgi:hypothetical protein
MTDVEPKSTKAAVMTWIFDVPVRGQIYRKACKLTAELIWSGRIEVIHLAASSETLLPQWL